ncbi:hypothetical protein [Pseudodesulfovibrio senegalensis]|uniref:Uncharacterized protein n=1 Tax=Pseudodesulfovibrio senegalensis TaxID=1721087 RepID=A0A6N6N728_9BACT|nr:hypothetical protein [Pseudodesulfovibrio senegalensis]KAB1442907.1 hypothetical protein F8A88_01125 [Pseudodesulfovibrio senegalensis]
MFAKRTNSFSGASRALLSLMLPLVVGAVLCAFPARADTSFSHDRPSYTLTLPGKWQEMPPVLVGDVGALAGTLDGQECVAVYGQPQVEKSMVVMVFASRRTARSRAAMQARCDDVRREHERFLLEHAPPGAKRHTSSRYDEARSLYSLRTQMGPAEVNRYLFFTAQGELHVVAFGPDSPLMSRVRQAVRGMSVGRGESGFSIPDLPFDLPGGVWPWLLIVGIAVFFWVGRR